jgi:hypothetical protein
VPLLLLPPEMVHHVLGFLDVASLASCYRVCHAWRALLRSATLWRGAYLALWTRSDAALHRATQRTIAEATDDVQHHCQQHRQALLRHGMALNVQDDDGGGGGDENVDDGNEDEDDGDRAGAVSLLRHSDNDNDSWRQGWRWRRRVRADRDKPQTQEGDESEYDERAKDGEKGGLGAEHTCSDAQTPPDHQLSTTDEIEAQEVEDSVRVSESTSTQTSTKVPRCTLNQFLDLYRSRN